VTTTKATTADLRETLARAIERRAPTINDPATTAFRALAGDDEGAPGLTIDLLGPAAVAQIYQGSRADTLDPSALAETVLDRLGSLGARAVYLKPFASDRSKMGGAPPETTDPEPTAGERTPETVRVLEDGRTLLAKPFDGFSTGVFVDQRASRRWLAERLQTLSAPSVLNLFAYTGAFGVAAAAAGAATSNVDVSGRYLAWAENNYRANNIDLGAHDKRHHFPRMDAREFVAMAARKRWLFDAVVIDPPSFGAPDKRKKIPAWNAERGYAGLARDAARLVAPGGVMLCVTNTRPMCAPGVLESVVGPAIGRAFRPVTLPPPDADVAMQRGRVARCAPDPPAGPGHPPASARRRSASSGAIGLRRSPLPRENTHTDS